MIDIRCYDLADGGYLLLVPHELVRLLDAPPTMRGEPFTVKAAALRARAKALAICVKDVGRNARAFDLREGWTLVVPETAKWSTVHAGDGEFVYLAGQEALDCAQEAEELEKAAAVLELRAARPKTLGHNDPHDG